MASLSDFADLLGPQTVAAWPVVAEVVPAGTVLMDGTALAIRLSHRRSEDLVLFTPDEFDPDPLSKEFERRGVFRLARHPKGHLHGTFNGAKLDVLWSAGALTLEAPTIVEGIAVGSVQDILATKFRAITSRHILRDYFDVMSIEEHTGIRLEEGLGLYVRKYGIDPQHGSVHALVAGLGFFDDVEDDPALAHMAGDDVRNRVVAYFTSRHAAVVRAFRRVLDPPGPGWKSPR